MRGRQDSRSEKPKLLLERSLSPLPTLHRTRQNGRPRMRERPFTRRGAPGRGGRLRGATRLQAQPYLKLWTRLEIVRLQPSTKTKSSNLNGSEIIAGGNMNMPILINTEATTVSMMMKGR
jgi:hypothetical protein